MQYSSEYVEDLERSAENMASTLELAQQHILRAGKTSTAIVETNISNATQKYYDTLNKHSDKW